MNRYEFTFILDDTKVLKTLEEVLESFDGKKVEENAWGKRTFAYPINKLTAGEYFTWQIDMPSEKLNDFKLKLNYDQIVMRYLIMTVDQRVKKVAKPRKEKKAE
ncbi:MAG: 30S ribosomal protein S6 [Weeksellaceae bacterium]